MVGGVSGGYPVLVPIDRPGDWRETPAIPVDRVRAPARSDESQAPRRDPSYHSKAESAGDQPEPDLFQRQLEAQAQIARMEQDDLSLLPRQSRQALQTYGSVAGAREDTGVELVGLDLRV